MLHFKLRTLLIAGAILPPIFAAAWWLGVRGPAGLILVASAALATWMVVEGWFWPEGPLNRQDSQAKT